MYYSKYAPILGLFLLFFVTPTFVQAQGIEFEKGSWDAIKAKAQKENKPIFVDAYTTWCGPCKWMSKNIFTQEAIGAYFKENFIAVKLDMEKGEGPAFAKKHQVNAFPTLLYFSPEGELLHRSVGARDSANLMVLCEEALSPEKQFATFEKKYAKGERNPAFLKDYLAALQNAGVYNKAVFDDYWKTLNEDAKISEESLELISYATRSFRDYKDPLITYYFDNRAAYEQRISENWKAMVINNIKYYGIHQANQEVDAKKRKQTLKEISTLVNENPKVTSTTADFRLLQAQGKDADPKKLDKALVKYLKYNNDMYTLNNYAWDAYEMEDDPKKLKRALKWVNRSIAIEAKYFNLDTQAALHYKLKDYEAAKKSSELSIQKGKKEGLNDERMKGAYQLLENIKAKLS